MNKFEEQLKGKNLYTGKPCVFGHTERFISTGACRICNAVTQKRKRSAKKKQGLVIKQVWIKQGDFVKLKAFLRGLK
jgi:hypothetical protein